jgi:predicted MPP superfamily phosphohydrolase
MEIKIPVRIPIKNVNNANLVENDKKLLQIEDLIDAKRQLLLDKQKKIKFISKQNEFLDVVKNDYVKYYTYISQQKQDQMKALELLKNYIHDLTVSGKLSKNNIEDAKVEQNKILHEIKSIKKGLDSIMTNTVDLNSIVQEKHI